MDNSTDLRLHDAELIGMVVDRINEFARFEFRLENGALRSAQLDGLKAFRSEDMTLQNVVSRVLRSSKGEIARERIEHWLVWATSLSDADSWLSDQRKREWLDACGDGALELVVIEPSAGAQIAAVCARITVI